MTSDARVIDAPGLTRFEIAPHHCFACGTLNAQGMQLDLHVEPSRAWTDVTLAPRFQGWDGIAHGGILCTILDEVMAWSLASTDDWGVTARMSVEFKRPVALERPLRAEGRVTGRRRRIIETEATLVGLDTGLVLATATGVYVAADAERKAELRARFGLEGATPAAGDAGR